MAGRQREPTVRVSLDGLRLGTCTNTRLSREVSVSFFGIQSGPHHRSSRTEACPECMVCRPTASMNLGQRVCANVFGLSKGVEPGP
jgi:hypothetical protein